MGNVWHQALIDYDVPTSSAQTSSNDLSRKTLPVLRHQSPSICFAEVHLNIKAIFVEMVFGIQAILMTIAIEIFSLLLLTDRVIKR